MMTSSSLLFPSLFSYFEHEMWPTVNKQLWRLSVHKFCNNKYTNVIVSKTKNTTEQLKCNNTESVQVDQQ